MIKIFKFVYEDGECNYCYLVNKSLGYWRGISEPEKRNQNLSIDEPYYIHINGWEEDKQEIFLKDLPKEYINNLTNLEYIQLKGQEL